MKIYNERIIEIMNKLGIDFFKITTNLHNNELYDEVLFHFKGSDYINPKNWLSANEFHSETRKLLKEMEILILGEES